MPVGLPLGRSDRGEAVRDLQRRLSAVGFDISGDEPGVFGDATTEAVRTFQSTNGLRIDGICGNQTWSALVEAGYCLGDRLLYLRRPMLRGDDVAALQHRLGALGFDAGRVDGIFGERTQAAVMDFQRNAGLTVDGTCGPATLAELERIASKAGGGQSVANVREREALRHAPRTLTGRRVVIGQPGGLASLSSMVARELAAAGAQTLTLDDLDDSEQARQANDFTADLFVGLAAGGDAGCLFSYYSTQGFESPGGRRLAELIRDEVLATLGPGSAGTRGMRLPVLRETRMPAVVCELAPLDEAISSARVLANAIARAVGTWVEVPEEV